MTRTLIAALAFAVALLAGPLTASAAAAPDGLTGMAGSGQVELAWQPDAGPYRVFRGTSAQSLQPIAATAGARFTDTGLANGTTYYYGVAAAAASSPSSLVVAATPRAAACSSGSPVVVENCRPGDAFPKVDVPTRGIVGIEGFATARSVDQGGSVDVKVRSAGAYDVRVYRTGDYGGRGARLFSTILGVPADSQSPCAQNGTTGLVDCAAWRPSLRLTTTAAWPSGVYLLELERRDNGADNQVLVVVRDDSRQPDVLYGVPMSTYQAYNAWGDSPAGGKSLYEFNSVGAATVAGTSRAVKVSYDRPFEQPRDGGALDWYPRSDLATVAWLERSGYDVAYEATDDLELLPGRLRRPGAYVSGTHDEYYSAGMRAGLEEMRDHGVDLLFSGANAVYEKVRFEAGGRVLVCYKSTISGPPDPSGTPTGTWRDPAGAASPENALLGGMYIGDNGSNTYPLAVTAEQGRDLVWSHTGLDALAPGTSVAIGTGLVGWEWDAPVANGRQPAGLTVVSGSNVFGNLLQDAGATYRPGNAVASAVRYTAGSGAHVFATGTMHWNRGLALNADGRGEPEPRIQQATTNVLMLMGVRPATPAPGIHLPPLPIAPVAAGPATPIVPPAAKPPATRPRLRAAPLRLRSRFAVRGATTRVTRLEVLAVPARAVVELRCRGGGCSKGVKRRTYRKAARVASLTAWLRGRRLRTGAVLEIRVLRTGQTGRVERLTIRRGKQPTRRTLCLPVGGRRVVSC